MGRCLVAMGGAGHGGKLGSCVGKRRGRKRTTGREGMRKREGIPGSYPLEELRRRRRASPHRIDGERAAR
jgi:hypothetical protein